MPFISIPTKRGLVKLDANIASELRKHSLCFSGDYPSFRVVAEIDYKGFKVNAYAIVAIHRFVVAAKDSDYVDHKNGNKLDARKTNLRICTHAENLRNRPKSKNNTSGFKGVRKTENRDSWWATIMKDKKKTHLGCYGSAEIAARVWDRAAVTLHGEFVSLNFPEDAKSAASYVVPDGMNRSQKKSKYGTGVYRTEQGTFYVQVPSLTARRNTTVGSKFVTAEEARAFRINYINTRKAGV